MLGGSLAGQTALGDTAGVNDYLPTYARPTFRAMAEAGAGSGTDLVLTKPSGTAEGDILGAYINKESTTTFGLPSGWQAAAEFNTNGGNRVLYAWKRATASEGASYTFDMDSGGGGAPFRNGIIAAFSNCVATGDPNSVTPSTNAPTGTTNDLPHTGITPAHVGAMLLSMSGWFNDTGAPGRALAAAFQTSRQSSATYLTVALGERIHQGSYPIPATGDLPWVLLGTAEARRSGVLAAIKPLLIPVLTPATASLALTGYAPTVSGAGQVFTPATKALTLTGFAPVLGTGLVPAPASLALTTFAPTVTVGSGTVLTPGAASLTLTGYAPTLNLGLTPSTGTLTTATFAPTVTVGSGTTLVPGTATLTLTAFAPALDLRHTPGAASLTITGYAPTVTLGSSTALTPGAATLTLTGYAPVLDLRLTPATAALTLTGYAMKLDFGITPGMRTLTLTTYIPMLALPQTLTPGTGSIVLTPYAPSVVNGGALFISTVYLGASYIPIYIGAASYAPVVTLEAVQE